MRAELCGENFRSPLTRVIAPSLKILPDSSIQRLFSAHLKFHSLQARWNLKEGAIPEVAPIWPVCLLFEIFYKLYLSTNDLQCELTLEGTHESAWTCACPRLLENGIGTELEGNRTIAVAFGLKPNLWSNYVSHAFTPRSLRSRALYQNGSDFAICAGARFLSRGREPEVEGQQQRHLSSEITARKGAIVHLVQCFL